MKWVIRIVITLFFCFVFFGAIQHYFHLDLWATVFISVVAAVLTALGASLEFAKKWYDALEAPYKFQKARREEAEAERVKSSVISAPTPNELKIYGQSQTERILHERFKTAGPDALNPRPFVVDSSERKL